MIGSFAALGLKEKGLSSTLPDIVSAAVLQQDPLLKMADKAFMPAFYTKNKLLVLPDKAWTVQAVGARVGRGRSAVARQDQQAGAKGRQGNQQQQQVQTGEEGFIDPEDLEIEEEEHSKTQADAGVNRTRQRRPLFPPEAYGSWSHVLSPSPCCAVVGCHQ